MNNEEVAVFGGGCFWCTEAVFSELEGVSSVVPGYAGGHAENPTYAQVCGEGTGHAEVIEVRFDPSQVTYQDLLEVFMATHDPTTLNRQGADQGARYRSIILYTGETQRGQADDYLSDLKTRKVYKDPVVTEVQPLGKFFQAEAVHKDYYLENPDSMYCQFVIRPKVEKFRKEFTDRLRPS